MPAEPAETALLGAVQEITSLRAVVRELIHQSPVTDGRSLTVDDLDLLPTEREAFNRAIGQSGRHMEDAS